MSYSFNARGTTKDEAKAKIAEELDKVVASQPIHEADRDAAQTTAHTFVDMLMDPAEGQVISVSVSGSVMKYRTEQDGFNSTNISVGASVMDLPKQ